METAEFVPYMGFGTLDPESVATQDGKTTALYRLGEEVVYRVEMGDLGCILTEFYDGRSIATTMHTTLQACFTHHMMHLTPSEHPRLVRLHHQFNEGRNIYLRLPARAQSIFFPAGLIFTLRQPLVPERHEAWETLKAFLEQEDEAAPAQFAGESPAILLKLLESGEVHTEEVKVGDCRATLFNLTAAADLLWQSGVVPLEKEYRLTILEAAEARPGQLPIYLGDQERDFLTFAILSTGSAEVALNQVIEPFRRASRQFLDSLQK